MKLTRLCLLALIFGAAFSAQAAVYLGPSSTGATTPLTVVASPGGQFSIPVYLTINGGEDVTAITYSFQANDSTTYFSLLNTAAGRDISTSQFSTVSTDYDVTNFATISVANAALDPQAGAPMGGVPAATLTANGTYLLATYTFTVSPATPLNPTGYSISTFSPAGLGWGDENFEDHSFSQQAAYTIVVVPEPATCALLAAGSGLVFVRLRRKGALL